MATSPPSRSDEPQLVDLCESDFVAIASLAATIWREHYTPIIGAAQVEYMLDRRFIPEKLGGYIGAADRWFKVLCVGVEPVGYCSYALVDNREMKLEQLYLVAGMKGRKLGGFMLSHVEAVARAHERSSLVLTVNKNNRDSIAVYRKLGFVVREEAVFDIGGGYVMDDYVMVKSL